MAQQLDVSLVGVNAFLSTHAGRDQVGESRELLVLPLRGRAAGGGGGASASPLCAAPCTDARPGKFVNYAARGVVGVLSDRIAGLGKDEAARRKALEESRNWWKRLMTSVGDARRTVRWFSGLGIVLALRKLAETGACPWTNPTMFAVSQLGLLWWHALDHYRWLVMNQLVGGDAALSTRLKNVSFTGFVVSSFVQSVYFANKLVNPPPGQLLDRAKERESQRGLAKALLTLVATLHISELYATHEAVCGAAGALTSLIVVYETFPRVK